MNPAPPKPILLALCFSSLLLALFSTAADPPVLPEISGNVDPEKEAEKLAKLLKSFPEADLDKDGKLTREEALAYREKALGHEAPKPEDVRGATPWFFSVDPGWSKERFPDHALCYKTPEEMKKLFPDVVSFEKPKNGALRVIGTGHSFMEPGYRTLPHIAKGAGFDQPLYTHIRGGIQGSTRYLWELENGIFERDGNPYPKLISSISNGEWDAMMWGPYFNDKPEYYTCWMNYCLKFNPEMKFYLSDAWPSLMLLGILPTSEKDLTTDLFKRLGVLTRGQMAGLIKQLHKSHPGKAFILPTTDAMILAVDYYHKGKLPGVEGINKSIGDKERSLWSDPIGHLGPGIDRLEGYVFYSTLYGKSAELIKDKIPFAEGDYPCAELDMAFRKIAWEAVTNSPHSGFTDKDNDGIGEPVELGGK